MVLGIFNPAYISLDGRQVLLTLDDSLQERRLSRLPYFIPELALG